MTIYIAVSNESNHFTKNITCGNVIDNLPGQLSFENDHKGQGVPFDGPSGVPGRHDRVDWQNPQASKLVQGEQRPMETLFFK